MAQDPEIRIRVSMDAAIAAMERLNKGAANTGRAVDSAGKQAAGAAGGFTSAAAAADKVAEKMTKAGAAAAQATENIKKTGKAAKDAGDEAKGGGDGFNTLFGAFLSADGASRILRRGLDLVAEGFKYVVTESAQFEDQIADLSALTGFVGKDLDIFRDKAKAIGVATLQSATEAVDGMRIIGSMKPELLGNALALNQVADAAALLADASGLKMPVAARELTIALNQMRVGSEKAEQFVNTLAAAARLGASTIPEMTTAIVRAGTVAVQSGISFEQLAATITRLREFGTPMEIMGTSLRNIFTILSVKADEFNPKIQGLKGALDNLAAAQMKPGELAKLIGQRNSVVLQQMIDMRHSIEALIPNITNTNEAFLAASRRSDSLIKDWERLKNTADVLAISLGENLQGPLRGVVQWLREVGVGWVKALQTPEQVANMGPKVLKERIQELKQLQGNMFNEDGSANENFRGRIWSERQALLDKLIGKYKDLKEATKESQAQAAKTKTIWGEDLIDDPEGNSRRP
jgi:hypothetical protein